MPSAARLLVLALTFAAGGCATSGSLGRGATYAVPGGGPAIAAQARAYTGAAYRAGGTTPGGFDCSGFVQYLYGQAGVALLRTAESQFDVGRHLRARDIEAGDLVFFRTDGHRVSHVGVATGDGGFIHAPNARSQVRVDRLDAPYWAERFAG